MLKNYLTLAVRTLRKHPSTTAINVAGLAIGLAACVLIVLFIQHERSFDRFHANADRLYRLTKTETFPDQPPTANAVLPGNVAPALEADFPEIEEAVRTVIFNGPALVQSDEVATEVEHLAFADAAFFEVFDGFDLVRGDPATVLDEPLSVVLTEAAARRLFGEADPVGQVVQVGEGEPPLRLTVTGVARHAPTTSHLQFGALVSWATTLAPAHADAYDWLNRWITNSVPTYVLLQNGTAPEALEAKLPDVLARHIPERADRHAYALQPLPDVHLGSGHLQFGFNWQPGSPVLVGVFGIAAVLLLLIAIVNFVNLTTARATLRAREVGVRKSLGAQRRQLVGQFLGESVLLSAAASAVAVALVVTALPAFASAVGRPLGLEVPGTVPLLAGVLGLGAVVGVLAGLYPAFVLSGFRPAAVLKQARPGGTGSARLRSALVVGQFAVAVALLAGTAVVLDQMRYLQAKDLGFDREQVLTFPLRDGALQEQYATFKTELLRHPGIVAVAASNGGPGEGANTYSVRLPGSDTEQLFPMIGVEPGFERTYGLDLVAGRGLREDLASDSTAVVINATLAQQIAETPTAAVGQEVRLYGEAVPHRVVGVVRDFHTNSLHEAVGPLLLFRRTARNWQVSVRVRPDAVPEALAHIERAWEARVPERAFRYTFLDDAFAQLYDAERRLMQLLGLFAGLAAVIACLGLFGLAAFVVERRTKEIGIRKALGATAAGIAVLLSRDFLKLVGLACLVGVPLAYAAAARWLGTFSYHVELGPAVFVAASAVALFVALATVSAHALRAATADPVAALRSE
ncbi:MAG: ABC transporter permease [Rhodothermales bacterium]|nr:ABC transporter permease [Rhodothermales bacterium]